MKRKKGRLSRAIKLFYIRFVRMRGEPVDIALGLALGLFIGVSPLLGFHTALAVLLAALFKWNKITAALGVWICNPVTAPFLFGATYLVGAKLLGMHITAHAPGELEPLSALGMLQKAPDIFWALLLGGGTLGLPIAFAGYYISLFAIKAYRRKIGRD